MTFSLAKEWANSLGLVSVPLFRKPAEDSAHHVLLDGERGSFTLSEALNKEVDVETAASWSWSADLPHYVGVDKDYVILHRWDDPSATQRFTRRSIESRLESFYEFLRLDRVKSRLDVVEHSVDVFRRIRSLVHEEKMSDESSIHIFLLILAQMLDEGEVNRPADLERLASTYNLSPSFFDVYQSLVQNNMLATLVGQFRSPVGLPYRLEIVPELLVRHASGIVFQEAHYELVSGGIQTDLFGVPGEAKLIAKSRGGTHFTPPGLARSIVEQALGEIEKEDLVVLDPACGAGTFLHETLRYFQLHNHRGNITLLGYDVSSAAVAMAHFTLTQARQDWPEGKIQIRIESRDALEDGFVWPESDVVLMNPPFISWVGMNTTQREQVRSMLGNIYSGRPDYSMAFIEKALDSTNLGGVIGTLMPASILSLDASLGWRRHLLERAVPRYLATLSDYTLFRHAMVEAAYIVLAKRDLTVDGRMLSLWTSGKRGNTGEALRNLRRLGPRALQRANFAALELQSSEDWNASIMNASSLREMPNWRPKSNRFQNLLERIRESTQSTVADVFHVRQGIRTGHNKVFIIPESKYSKLPKRERPYFRPAVGNRNISSGRILPRDYVFYPSTLGVDPIRNETDLKRLLSTYYEQFLRPNREELEARASLRDRDWWNLSEPRSWLKRPDSKLISAYFGDSGSFAWDEPGEYALIQGYAWLTRPSPEQQNLSFEGEIDEEESNDGSEPEFDEATLFKAYLALLNSSFFELLLSEFCPRVAGGQYDLSPRFVNQTPVPNLLSLGLEDPAMSSNIRSLANEGEKIHLKGLSSIRSSDIDYLVSEIYRTPLELWPETDE